MTKKDLLVSAEFLLDRDWVRIARESTAAPECCFTSDDAGLPENELWCSNIGCAAVCFGYTGSMVCAAKFTGPGPWLHCHMIVQEIRGHSGDTKGYAPFVVGTVPFHNITSQNVASQNITSYKTSLRKKSPHKM
jgi:hypothetical protein